MSVSITVSTSLEHNQWIWLKYVGDEFAYTVEVRSQEKFPFGGAGRQRVDCIEDGRSVRSIHYALGHYGENILEITVAVRLRKLLRRCIEILVMVPAGRVGNWTPYCRMHRSNAPTNVHGGGPKLLEKGVRLKLNLIELA